MNWFRSPVANSLFYGSINAVLRPKYATRCTACECVAQSWLGFADGLVLVCQILGKHDAFYAHGQLPLRKPVAQLCALAQLHGFVHGRMHAVAAMCCFASLLFDSLSTSLRVLTAVLPAGTLFVFSGDLRLSPPHPVRLDDGRWSIWGRVHGSTRGRELRGTGLFAVLVHTFLCSRINTHWPTSSPPPYTEVVFACTDAIPDHHDVQPPTNACSMPDAH